MTADDDVVVKLEQVLLRDGIFRRDQAGSNLKGCVDTKQNVALKAKREVA